MTAQQIAAHRRPRSRSWVPLALAALLACLCWLLLVSAVLANPTRRIAWTLPGSANAGSPVAFSWTAGHLRPGDRLVVQRQEGLAHAWLTMLRLPTEPTGSAQLPGLPLGSYHLRIAVVGRGVVQAQQPRSLNVFGKVPLSTLFGSSHRGVYATPTTAFPYVLEANDLLDGARGTGVITVAHNPCQAIFLEFVPGTSQAFPLPAEDYIGDVGTLAIVQESLDPASASAAFDAVNSVNDRLVPGQSWSVNVSQPANEESLYFYMNGYGSCDRAVVLGS